MPNCAPPLPRFGWESPHHEPHSLCCAPIVCFSRFSANAGFRSEHLAVVSSYHQIRSAPHRNAPEAVVISDVAVITYIRAVVPKLQPCEPLWPQSGASFSDFFKRLCTDTRLLAPQLESILTATWRGHSALSGIQIIGQNCCQRKEVVLPPKTARNYINETVSTLAQITLTAPSANGHRQVCQNPLSTGYVDRGSFSRLQHPNARGGSARFYAVEAAGSGGCSSAMSRHSATAAAHTCHLSASAGEQLMRPGPQDQGRTVQVLSLSCAEKKY